MYKLACAALICAVFATAAHATTYYVTTSGSDANNCTNNTTQACATFNYAISKMSSGDSLSIGSGTYDDWIDGNSIPSGGSWATKTQINGAGINLVTIRPDEPGNEHECVKFGTGGATRSYIQFFGFTCDMQDGKQHSTPGIQVDNATNIRFQKVRVKNSYGQNIGTGEDASGIEFIQVESIDAGAIQCNGPHQDNEPGYCHGFYVWNVFISKSLIQNNDGLGVQWYGSNLTIKNSIITNNNNIGVLLAGDVAQLYNNTVAFNAGWELGGGGGTAGAGSIVRNNIFWDTDSDKAEYGDYPQDHNLTSNPSFVSSSNFHLANNGSAAVNTGSSTGAPADDYDGVTRPKCTSYDIGAYEWNGTCP